MVQRDRITVILAAADEKKIQKQGSPRAALLNLWQKLKQP